MKPVPGSVPGSRVLCNTLEAETWQPAQYSCLETTSWTGGAWWAIAQKVAKSRTRLSDGATASLRDMSLISGPQPCLAQVQPSIVRSILMPIGNCGTLSMESRKSWGISSISMLSNFSCLHCSWPEKRRRSVCSKLFEISLFSEQRYMSVGR